MNHGEYSLLTAMMWFLRSRTPRGEPHVGLAHDISGIRWRTSLAIDEIRCGAYVHKYLGTLARGRPSAP